MIVGIQVHLDHLGVLHLVHPPVVALGHRVQDLQGDLDRLVLQVVQDLRGEVHLDHHLGGLVHLVLRPPPRHPVRQVLVPLARHHRPAVHQVLAPLARHHRPAVHQVLVPLVLHHPVRQVLAPLVPRPGGDVKHA